MRDSCLFVVFTAVCLTPLASASVTQPISTPSHRTPIDAAVDAAVKAFFTDTCHVGLSIAVVDNKKGASYFYNYGSTSRAHPQRPRATTLYEIASITKTFTGALAAKAVTDGIMDLDTDFRTYLLAPYPNLQFGRQPITLRTLASHTSGMPRDIPDTDAAMKDPDAATLPTRLLAIEKGFMPASFPAALARTSLRSAPGKTEAYSNAGMKVIAMGLEQVYGVSFEALLQRVILAPLKMKDTGFVVSVDRIGRLAAGYGRDGKSTPYHTFNAGPSWGLYSNTADMAKYVSWQLDENDPVIAQAHLPITGNANDGKGMIWNEGIDHGERMLWHGGGSFGMSSQVVLFPTRGQGFVLLSNDACAGTEAALKAIAMRAHGHGRP